MAYVPTYPRLKLQSCSLATLAHVISSNACANRDVKRFEACRAPLHAGAGAEA